MLYIAIINTAQNIIVPKLYAGFQAAKHNTIPIISVGIKTNAIDIIALLYAILYCAKSFSVCFNECNTVSYTHLTLPTNSRV